MNDLRQEELSVTTKTLATMSEFFKNDFCPGIRNVEGWLALSNRTVKSLNRRSKLGVLWAMLSAAIFVASVSLVYSTVFSMNLSELLPHITIGFISWNLIAGSLASMPTLFLSYSSYITQKNLPYTLYIVANATEKLMIFVFQSAVILVVCCIIKTGLSPVLLILPISLALLFITAISASFSIALIAIKYRDLGQIINSSLLLIFLLTPIIWKPEFSGQRKFIVDLNPFYHYIHVIRSPILDHQIPWISLGVTLLTAVLFFCLSMFLMGRFRHRLVFWI